MYNVTINIAIIKTVFELIAPKSHLQILFHDTQFDLKKLNVLKVVNIAFISLKHCNCCNCFNFEYSILCKYDKII